MDVNQLADLKAKLTETGMETASSTAIDFLFPDSDGKEFDGDDRRQERFYSIVRKEVTAGVEAAEIKAATDPDGLDWTAFLTAMESAGIRAAKRYCGQISP